MTEFNRSLAKQFFDFDPEKFIEDVYNAADDYAADGLDKLESSLQTVLKKKRKGKSSKHMQEELSKGCDTLLEKMRQVFDRNFDRFEVYTLRNIFNVSDEAARQATADHAIDKKASDEDAEVNNDGEAENVEQEIIQLRETILQERRRYRTLLVLKKMYERRLPELRSAVLQMCSSVDTLAPTKTTQSARAGESARTVEDSTRKVEERVTQLTDEASRLRSLCDRLNESAQTFSDSSSRHSDNNTTSSDLTSSHNSRISFGGLRAQYARDRQGASSTD